MSAGLFAALVAAAILLGAAAIAALVVQIGRAHV